MSQFEISGRYNATTFAKSADAVRALTRDLGQWERKIPDVLRRDLTAYLQDVADKIADKNSTAWPAGTTSTSVSRRSGKMVESIRESVKVSGSTLNDLVGFIGGNGIAMVHEFGATITAKAGGFLTVPLPEAFNSDGTAKYRSARDWSDTFVKRSRNGNLLIFQKRGVDIVPLYVLKTSVTIIPRLGMRDMLEKGLPGLMRLMLADVTKEFGNA